MSIIQLKHLRKSYDSNLVLKDINLDIEAGQIVGYIGPNGAGKSTTIKILCGIISEFEGSATVMDIDVRTNPLAVKQIIGYIPEQAALYEVLTPTEYLRFSGKLYNMNDQAIATKTTELLRLFDLHDKAHTRMTNFSKGMKQKVLLISGLIHNPSIIFLDEPLSGLDANAVILVKEILSQLKAAGKTIFYSSHIMDVVEKISDRIIIIDKGEVKADGSFNELQSNAHLGSLENIFTALTGNSNQQQNTANEFINVLKS
ncbi:ABC transporter ATP-binding protein [Ferruginibacter yonginensis]|uniref:ABC transporter ATP-binding protein n=1 Tax=Ferruginibacter yonginensis TaxID=1310416 RepID=A0ABV8QS39_9BACT